MLNLIYDMSCTAIPWDNVDKEYLAVPRKWDSGNIGKFMLWIGPTSSVFDITTYLLMYFVICPAVTLLTFAGIAVLTVILFTAFGASIGLAALPPVYFAWLALTILLYMVLATVFKKVFVRRYGELL